MYTRENPFINKIMNNDFKTIYKALNTICDLSKDESLVCLKDNIKLNFRKISTNNKYFFEIDVIVIKDSFGHLDYTEFRIRVWNNYLAEIVMFKLPEFSEYKNVYRFGNGYEIPNKLFQFEASKSFLGLLQ